ncbi:oligomeric Golgi complex subunit 6 [Sphaerosporella brunnea]|uniref:Conserved oligomeric Golgi complex subunit 6 n=1 Tax=Sphaerosporella brunnea TaxID=1250544 RepID=A0A5J5EP86_9PEZI|nr:oligomeric Golgi complex subunit 6 [Sphaerosporella brunnea]
MDSTTSSASQQRLASVLSASYIDADIRNALGVLDSRFVENTAESRRQLRVNVQGDVIRSNAQIVRDFAQVAEQLTRIGSALDNMNNVVSAMRARTTAASMETGPILEEFKQLVEQKKVVGDKQVLLSAFTEHFTVPEEDIVLLTSSAEPVDDRFFQVLQNVKRIHTDCQVLLASGNERVGTETMDEMVKHLHAAFQKLFRWVQRELKTLSLENPQVNSGIRRALRVLAERPALFQNCLDFFSEARQKILLDSFYTAMTGSTHGTAVDYQIDHATKPIEVYAHDPLRYIGDMLAWLHSTAVGEQEALEVLFITPESSEGSTQKASILSGIEEGLKSSPWVDPDVEDTWDPRRGLMQLVDKNLETVCKPLRARIEQAIASQDSSTLTYKLTNLINFYRLTFQRLLGEDSNLLSIIQSLHDSSTRQFHSTLSAHVRSVQSNLPQPPSDLSAPAFLVEALKDLTSLLTSFQTSLSPDSDFSKILSQALDPYLDGCITLSTDLPTQTDASVFVLNCLAAAQKTLQGYTFTSARQQELESQIDARVNALAESTLEKWLAESGLADVGGHEQERLHAASEKLDLWLPSAYMDTRAALRAPPALLDRVMRGAAERFVKRFEEVEEAVMRKWGDDEGRMWWPRTREEVAVLLS